MSEPRPPRPLPGPGPLSFLLGGALVLWVLHRAVGHGADWGALPPPQWPWALASLALLGLAFAWGVQLWRFWLRASGGSLGYVASFRLLHRSQLAKYLPGAFWHLLGGAALARREGLPLAQGGLTMLLDLLGQVAGALVVALAIALVGAPGGAWAFSAGGALAALVVALHPLCLNGCLAGLGRLTHRPFPRIHLGHGRILGIVLLNASNWALIALAFACFVKAFVPDAPAGRLAQAFPLAWVAGLLSPISPAGLGVREASLSLLLAEPLGPSLAASLALFARLWFLAGEWAAFCVALLLPEGPKDAGP